MSAMHHPVAWPHVPHIPATQRFRSVPVYPTVAMSESERLVLADKLAAEYTRQLDYIRTQTVMFGLLPVLYGLLTFAFGDDLWSGSVVYRTALSVPYAPESWGVTFVTLGVGVMLFSWTGRQRLLATWSMATALILSMFMVTFLTEWVANDNPSGLPPGIIYAVLAMSFMNRARLAWISRR